MADTDNKQWLSDLEDELQDVLGSAKQDERVVVSKIDNKSALIPVVVAVILGVLVVWAFSHNRKQVEVETRRAPTVQEQMEYLYSQQQKLNMRVTLEGMLFNQNMAQIERYNRTPGMIYIQEDWTIKRMPDNLKMNPHDEAFLRQRLKP